MRRSVTSRANTADRLSAPARGFGLVEIMVAVLIGLLLTIVIYQVFTVFEGQKRTTTSGGDAQQNGLLALYTIAHDVRMSGYGINYLPLLGCTVNAYDVGPPIRNFSFTMAPVQITDGAGGSPDSVTIVYGNSNTLMSSVELLQSTASTDTLFVVANAFGFAAGDVIMAGQVGKSCGLATVSSVVGSNVNHTAGTYTDSNGATQTARYNASGGLGVAYDVWDVAMQAGGRLFDLGPSPVVVNY
jgi:type IV pilus assembly protein PilW